MTRKRTDESKARRPQRSPDPRAKRGHGAKPEAVRERAVLALLSEKTVTDAANKAGVDESTLRRWLQCLNCNRYSSRMTAVLDTVRRVAESISRAGGTAQESARVDIGQLKRIARNRRRVHRDPGVYNRVK